MDTGTEWTEADSTLYRELAVVAVPAREEQIATMLTLMPFGRDDSFRVVELGCGEGALSFAILRAFPNAAVTALDGSSTMLDQTDQCLSGFRARVNLARFDLASTEWFPQLDAADCVVSSLCVHHLPAEEKQRLFAEAYARLSDRGALLIADLVEPQRIEARALFAAAWDRLTEAQSMATMGSRQLFEKFCEERWNYYRFPDPSDRPSPLFDQLTWLREAGFETVDCFWLQAGHAIYGGYKPGARAHSERVSFVAALESAHAALRAVSQAV